MEPFPSRQGLDFSDYSSHRRTIKRVDDKVHVVWHKHIAKQSKTIFLTRLINISSQKLFGNLIR